MKKSTKFAALSITAILFMQNLAGIVYVIETSYASGKDTKAAALYTDIVNYFMGTNYTKKTIFDVCLLKYNVTISVRGYKQ